MDDIVRSYLKLLPDKRLFTIADIATVLNTSPAAIYQLRKRGMIPDPSPKNVGRKRVLLFTIEEVGRIIRNRLTNARS